MYFYRCSSFDYKKAEQEAKQKIKPVVVNQAPVVAPVQVVETQPEVVATVEPVEPVVEIVPDSSASVGDQVKTEVGVAVVVEEAPVDVNRMSKSALFKLAADRGVEVSPTATRNELVKLLS